MLRTLLVTSFLSTACGYFPADNDSDDNDIVFHRPDAGDRADAPNAPIGIDASVQSIDAAAGGAADGGNGTGAPYVTSFSPTGTVPESAEIWVTFSEQVTNVTPETFQLYFYADPWLPVPGTVTYEPGVGARFIPDGPSSLGYGVAYLAVLSYDRITDLDGNHLIDPGNFSFCSVFCDIW